MLPLAATAFVATLQFTLVCEGWPLRRLRRIPAGACAVGVSWAVALLAYSTLLGDLPRPGPRPLRRRGGLRAILALLPMAPWLAVDTVSLSRHPSDPLVAPTRA